MDPRIEFYNTAFSQRGAGFEIPVFRGTSRYQQGAGFGDVLRGMWRFFKPVAIKPAQTLLRAGSEAIKEGATVKEVIKSTVQPTVGSVLGATVDQVASKSSLRCAISMTAHRHPIHPSFCLRWSRLGQVENVAARLYIRRRPNVSSILLTSIQ